MKASLLFLSLCAGIACADDVQLEWKTSASEARLNFYRPQRLTFSDKRPPSVSKLPEGVEQPRFGVLKLGPAESARDYVVVLEQKDDEHSRLWIDTNANGDLSDDVPVVWTARKDSSKGGGSYTWQGAFKAEVSYGSNKRVLSMNAYRFGKGNARQSLSKDSLFYYRDYGPAGRISIGGNSYFAALSDEMSAGHFSGSKTNSSACRFLVDLNDDGRFDLKSEAFDVQQPFNINGTTYEIKDMAADGTKFQFVKSDAVVAAREVPPALGIGTKPVAFTEKATGGQDIDFPAGFKGRVVMLDFWATWCGPCRGELPGLVKTYEEFHGQGFDVIGISLDNEQTLPKLAQFVEDNHMPWPQIADGKGWDSKLADRYGVRGIPAAWLIDGNTGLIVAQGTELRGASLRPTVERCLRNLGKVVAASPAPKATEPRKDEPSHSATPEDSVVTATLAAVKNGGMTPARKLLAQLEKPLPAHVDLVPPATHALRGRDIAQRASEAHVRVGWVYHCTRCSNWHRSMAGGYAIAGDVIVTAYHVMDAPERMKEDEGYPVLVTGNDRVLPVTAVLAADKGLDAVVLRIAGADLKPLALSNDAHPGDSAFCWSDPLGRSGYFTTGVVNRVLNTENGPRLNVSTDWAQGSSGAAVLDECGNVIGHVSRIEPLLNPARKPATDGKAANERATVMTLHEAISATGVLAMLEKMNRPAK